MQVIHQTDLFRPHADPDDHFDLACQYALASLGAIDLSLVLIDHPPAQDFLDEWEFLDSASNPQPDLAAIARLNRWSGLSVPLAVGSSLPMSPSRPTLSGAPRSERQGVAAVLDALRTATDGVAIHVVGSCRDLAYAIAEDPELFREKCRGIYLNAGLGAPQVDPDAPVEYNVALNHAAFSTILGAPCPVFWMPCYQSRDAEFTVNEFATWYDFEHREVLEGLDSQLSSYFMSMFRRTTTSSWLGDEDRPDEALLGGRRNMWCTGGFLHAAGLTVRPGGSIEPLTDAPDPVYEFIPVTVICDESGRTSWTPGWTGSGDQVWLYRVTDIPAYRSSMTRALSTLLHGEGRA